MKTVYLTQTQFVGYNKIYFFMWIICYAKQFTQNVKPYFSFKYKDIQIKPSNSVFTENRSPHRKFSVFLLLWHKKNRSRSPQSNQFFVISKLYIHENLVRIQPLVHKILCRQKSVTPRLMPMQTLTRKTSPPKSIYPPPFKWEQQVRGHNNQNEVCCD